MRFFIFVLLLFYSLVMHSQCDNTCKAIYLDIELRNTIDEFPHSSETEKLYKIDSLNLIVDSLRKEIELYQTDPYQRGNYNNEYRVKCVECWASEINQPLDTLISISERCLIIHGLYPVSLYRLHQISNNSLIPGMYLGSIYYTHTYVIPYIKKYPEIKNKKFNDQNKQDLEKVSDLLKPYFKKDLVDFNEQDILFLYQIYQIIQVKNGYEFPR